jgi:hypothetical protein
MTSQRLRVGVAFMSPLPGMFVIIGDLRKVRQTRFTGPGEAIGR